MVEGAPQVQPEGQPHPPTHETINPLVDTSCSHVSSSSTDALRRVYSGQEPGALGSHAAICAGGSAGQPVFLPRPIPSLLLIPSFAFRPHSMH
jgi:hypothetical protein